MITNGQLQYIHWNKSGDKIQFYQLVWMDMFIISTALNPLPDMPVLGSSNLTASKDMMWKI